MTHQLGWEVRLLNGAQAEVMRTQVCRMQEEVLTTGEQWKAAMGETRWRCPRSRNDTETPRKSALLH